MSEPKDTGPCAGCEDDFYNRGEKRCWSLETAQMQTLYRIGTWTEPTKPGAFTETKGYGCYHQQGVRFYKGVPSFVRPEDINVSEVSK